MAGFVSLVGAGPWDPRLLTLAGRDRLERADTVISDYLANPALLMHCRPEARIYQRVASHRDGAKLSQERVNELMVEHALKGERVVRLKGGDPMVFGRGAEEARVLREQGIEYEFIPGVSSPIAGPECAGIPITHRDHTPSVSFVSGFEAYEKQGLGVAWKHLAQSAGTLVLMMSVKNCGQNARKLMDAGRSADTPAALVRWGTRGIQRTVIGTLADIEQRVRDAGIRPPALMIVGEVVARRDELRWFEDRALYGRRVVVTRSVRQSHGLVHALSDLGADAVAFPCLEVVPPREPHLLQDAVRRAPDFEGMIISSPNGAQALSATLEELDLDARHLRSCLVAAIGTGTARALRKVGLRADRIPKKPRAEGLIEELRERGELARRWLHLRADSGRPLLEEAVRQAGGEFELVEAYRTVRPEVSSLLLKSLRPPDLEGEGYDAICFASGKAARHFLESTTEAFGEDLARETLRRAKVVVLGPITAAAVEAVGIRVDAVAASPRDEDLATAVVEVLRS